MHPTIPTLVVSTLALWCASGCHEKQPPGPPSAVTVEAIGRDFQWHFRYPGADGQLETDDDLQQERTLYLPPNADVRILLHSTDYVYSMGLPGYAPKEIAVPDLTFELNFRTRGSDRLDLLVDPLCGFRPFHDDVMGNVVIEDRDDYADWFGRGE